MYSNLLSLSKKTKAFVESSSGGSANMNVKRDTVSGNHIKVFIDSNGSLLDVSFHRQSKKKEEGQSTSPKERLLLVRANNMSMFPKVNFSEKFISFKNLPAFEKGSTDFSEIGFEITDEIEKSRRYCKEELLPVFSSPGIQSSLFGDSVIGYSAADLKQLFTGVFERLIQSSKTNDIARNILELFVFAKDSKSIGSKIPMIITVSRNGFYSTDVSEYTTIAKIIPSAPKKVVTFGNGKVEVYKNVPPYKFPSPLNEKIIFSRNPDSNSLSMNGVYGSEICIMPCERVHAVFDFLDFIFPEDGAGRFYSSVKVDGFSSAILSVVYDEDEFRGDLGEFLYGMTDKEKIELFGSLQKKMIEAYSKHKVLEVSSPVNFLLFGATDSKTGVGLILQLEMSRENVFEKIRSWHENELPHPRRLSECFETKFRYDGARNIKTIKTGLVFGYDKILKFVFTDDKAIEDGVLRILKENVKPFCLAIKNEETNIQNASLGFDMVRFIRFILQKRGNKMDSKIAEFGRLCACGDRLQLLFWSEHNIKNKFGRTIGSETINLVYSSRLGEAFRHLMTNIQKYIDWAKANQNKKDVYFAYKDFSSTLKNLEGSDFKAMFNHMISDEEVAEVSISYIGR